jgi:hypothetical protein
MDKTKSTMAHQIAQAAIAFEQRRTGSHVPKSVTVVLSEQRVIPPESPQPFKENRPCFVQPSVWVSRSSSSL